MATDLQPPPPAPSPESSLEYVDPLTGEIFALVSLGQWEQMVAEAARLQSAGAVPLPGTLRDLVARILGSEEDRARRRVRG